MIEVRTFTKEEILEFLKKELKPLGFIKQRQTWYKNMGNIMHIIDVQGSHWDKNNYYINFAIAVDEFKNKEYPSESSCQIRHRLGVGSDKEQINPLPDVIVKQSRIFFSKFDTLEKIKTAYKNGELKYGVCGNHFRQYLEK